MTPDTLPTLLTLCLCGACLGALVCVLGAWWPRREG